MKRRKMILQKKTFILVVVYLLLISIMMGGCTTKQQIVATTSKYPEKAITVIVPFSIGSALDMIARSLEKTAPKYLGQPLVILNKTGGGGAVAWNELSAANPDGYTLGMTAIDTLLLPQYGSSKYNYLTALDPLVQVAASPMVMVVQATQPWKSLDDLVEYAKTHPGQLKFGNSGVGTFPHVLGEMLNNAAGISTKQVPFNGAGEVITAVLGEHVHIAFVNPILVKEQVKSGTLRILAVTGEHRMTDPILAQIPTFKEQGFDITLTNWTVVAIPKETPVEVKNKLAEGFKAMITDPEFIKNMNNAGLVVEYLGSKDSQDKWLKDNQKLATTLQETGILELIKEQKK
jgi:tripartite-type tricarboxylate transporter receptor subunit TctC